MLIKLRQAQAQVPVPIQILIKSKRTISNVHFVLKNFLQICITCRIKRLVSFSQCRMSLFSDRCQTVESAPPNPRRTLETLKSIGCFEIINVKFVGKNSGQSATLKTHISSVHENDFG